MADDGHVEPTQTDPEPVTLPIRCQWCGRDVALTYRPHDHYRTGAWSCPYGNCQRIQKIDLKGSIVRVVAR
jgi:hypothetical protein